MLKKLLIITLILSSFKTYSQCACCAGAGLGSSNTDLASGIITLPKHQFVAEIFFDNRNIKTGNAIEADEKLLTNLQVYSAGIKYGITNNITVAALLPYVHLSTNAGTDNGFGDISIMSTINIFKKKSLNIALQAGIELPTGIQKEKTKFDDAALVIGSGSYDPMLGFIISKNWNKLTLKINGLYKITTNGYNDNYYGNLCTQGLQVSYAIKNNNFCSTNNSKTAPSNFGWNIFGGYYGEWLDKIKEDDVVDDNSGHYLGFLNLGTSISLKKWVLPLQFSLPVINNVNGNQNQAGLRFRFGFIKSF